MTKEQIKAYEEQIKPCPFCGGKARLYNRLGLWWVSCASLRDECESECRTRVFDLPDMAVKAWNKRGGEE